MSKRRRPPSRSRTGAAGRRTLVVDLLEIGSSHGNLTLRAGRDTGQLACIALPAEVLPDFLANLEQARLDAEEEYWSVVRHVMATAPGNSPADAARALEQWLLAQNWSKVLGALPDDAAHSLPLLSYAGHIGFRLAPPYTTNRDLAIFDPLQLHRLEPALLHHCSLAQQQAANSPVHPRDALALALRDLSSMPWPPGPAVEPSPEEASRYMQGRYEAFQRRSPYLRAEENNLDLGPAVS
ncbi:hypothetical protein [Streptomyces sp. Ag109_G2-15]|uniref:hypothetical protein n=1 Tax=Streptomyces sp. Ag109_G2-15 TaxID=1938850 RepID=UPI000BCCD61D|nr:hypothetical protein [Streptomyces sp. Ag109_G2-15]SOD91514.1 hypothetical protein SAMN06272765_7164 [Streptomyces sp. Ag109_G2-15]